MPPVSVSLSSQPNKNTTTTTTTRTTSTDTANPSGTTTTRHTHPHEHVSTLNRHSHYQTPPVRVRPNPQPQTKAWGPLSTTNQMSLTSHSPPSARRKISPLPEHDDNDNDYARFVQSLGMEDPILMASTSPLLLGDDEEDFELTDLEESDDEDIDDSHQEPAPLTDQPFEHDFYAELEAELGSLLEEDLEAAVSTLLAVPGTNKKNSPVTPSTPEHKISTQASSPTTPLRDAARNSFTVVTAHQVQQLQQLLRGHFQLLLQNSVLAVRAARKHYEDDSTDKFYGGETPEDLTEILDGAVSMLQDLDQNRKDAIRNYIQKGSALPSRLTRSAFQTLQQSTSAQSIFEVPGLARLNSIFSAIDGRGGSDILEPNTHADACRMLLRHAGANYDELYIPGTHDMAELLSDAKEVFGPNFQPPTTIPQQIQLRKNRIHFTAAEDNLVLRGVNLYGEKQWVLIADRYLPDRSVNIISQRYSKICLLLYKAHGVRIDEQGNLDTPPRFEKVEQLDEEALSKLQQVPPPAILNVHRWSIEEDVTLLKAVPLLGHMWAELSTRLIPHRDRGHLRKRYQVLERRVKATVQKTKRGGGDGVVASMAREPRPQSKPARQPKKSKVIMSEMPNATESSASIIRGPMPAHLLCPTRNHPGATLARHLPRRPNDGDNVNGGHLSSLHLSSLPEFDLSRDGSKFGRILSETNDDWSQYSRMKKMMENDTESLVASAIVNNLAGGSRDPPQSRGEGRKEIEQLPDMEIDSSSGLSMLNNTRDADAKDPSTPRRKTNGNFMQSVMDRTRKDPPENDHNMGAPAPVPSTPSRPPQRYPLFGTPLGVSPAPFLSPGTRTPVKGCFSPAAINSMMLGGGANTDDFALYPFELTEESRQALEEDNHGSKTMPLAALSHPHTPSNVDIFHDHSTLEAISALNSLSNSPATFLRKRPAGDMASSSDGGNGQSSVSQSLFAAVVGGVEKDSRKKKRK